MENEMTYEDMYVKVPILYKIAKIEQNSLRPKTSFFFNSFQFR